MENYYIITNYYNIIKEYILLFIFVPCIMTETLHSKKRTFLQHLREDARKKLTAISKDTNIPISTLFDFLKELQGTIFTRSTVLLNYPHLGYHAQAYIFVRVRPECKEKLRKHLLSHSNVNTVHKINNGWDFVVETIHKNIKDLDAYLELLEKEYGVEQKEIHYLIDEVKKEGFTVSSE